jgi:hypothetical protein
MLKETAHKTYLYNAHGHALSGRIAMPLNQIIAVQAGMSLPTTGGVGHARVDKYRFNDLVSFEAGYTFVSGSSEDNKVYSTLVTATVENLNILGVVTADRVVARLASTHNIQDDEARITILGSSIENLRVAGCEVHIDMDNDLFLRLTTFGAIRNEFQSNPEFRKIAADPFLTGQRRDSIEPCGVAICSLVKDMKIDGSGLKRQGHALEVPEFGRIFIGEVIAEHSKRTVTMLRMDLGCPVNGNVTAAQSIGNGRPYPPS